MVQHQLALLHKMNVIQKLEKRLFNNKFMGQDQPQSQPTQQPVMQTVEVPNEPVAPGTNEEIVSEAPVERESELNTPDREPEDRTAFNCPDCKGDGLKDQYSVCDRCKGTGKI